MRKAIAIDFDGCLCTDAAPEIGDPNWAVINRAKAEQRAGAGLILWTCREDQLLLDALDACKSWGLTFDSINESLPDWIEAFGNRPRKIGASEYWDDKAVGMGDNPPQVLEHLRELAQAEKDGRLVALPVKIGDKLFRLFAGEVRYLLVNNVIYRDVGGDLCKILVECIPFHRFYWSEDFGKTVFLTRGEAEEALKKREADDEAD